MEVKILYNYDNELYCASCKEKIQLGEKFSIVYEQLYNGEVIEKCYHIDKDCLPENEEEPYISPEEE